MLAAAAVVGCGPMPSEKQTETGAESVAVVKKRDRVVYMTEPGCGGVPAIPFNAGIADPSDFLQGGIEARVEGAQIRLYRVQDDHLVPVVIVPDLNKNDIAVVATCLGNHWKADGKITGNDILIVLAPHERRVRIATGADARDDLPDAEAAKIIDKMTSIFAKDSGSRTYFAEGLAEGIAAIGEQLKERS
jgi:uncharacterized protein